MRILVTGADGCVGRALMVQARARGMDTFGAGRALGDLADATVRERLLDEVRPDVVVFAAAFTAVDDAGRDPRARAINVEAPGAWARRVPTWWISSNFVFHGRGPHAPGAAPDPRGAYAEQKATAERDVRAAGGHVMRVGWVVGPGGRTFGSRLGARLRAGETVRAIADVVVQPTWSLDLASALLELPEGLTHHVGSGEVSWYGLALAVHARVGRGAVVPVRNDTLALPEPRPRDARLVPALLPPWWERLDVIAALDSPG